MDNKKYNFWNGWNQEASNFFGQAPSTITAWASPKVYTMDILIKHHKLMDWIEKKLVTEHGVPKDQAKLFVDKKRIGYEKCLED